MSKSSKEVEKNWKLKNGASGNSKGRPRGSKNKFTSLKDSFLEAFEALDGTEGLITWAKKSERNRAAFYGWITKMLPTNVTSDLTGDFNLTIKREITSEKLRDDATD